MQPVFKTQKQRWYLLGLVFLTVLVFSRTLFFEFVWDDTIFLVGQAAYEHIDFRKLLSGPINGVEYQPIRDLTYMLDYSLWGWSPLGFHLSNLVLYILNILVIYRFTRVLSSTILSPVSEKGIDSASWIALITASLFALHPLHSEIVSFIHCRNVLLSGLFFFLSCHYFLGFLESGRWIHVVISFIWFTFALLSKATVIMLPMILVTFAYFKQAHRLKYYLGTFPFFLLAIGFFFIYKFHATESNFIQEELTYGVYGISSRLAVAVQIPFFYIAKLVAPIGLSTEYQIEFTRDILTTVSIAAFFALGGLLLVTFALRKQYPFVFFSFIWFLVCLIPVSNIFLTNPVVADRYVYLSSFAFVYLAAVLIFRVGKQGGRLHTIYLLVPLLCVYSWITWDRNEVWRSQLTVMEDMTSPYSNRSKAFNALGMDYYQNEHFPEAFEYFRKAKEISPDESLLEMYQAALAVSENRLQEALVLLEHALRINPNSARSWILRGEIYESSGDLIMASWSYRKSLDVNSADFVTKRDVLPKLQRVQSRLAVLFEAERSRVDANPLDLNGKAAFAIKLQRAGFRQQAIAVYEQLLEQGGPNWQVFFNLGLLYADEKQVEESLRNYEKSLSLNESSATTHNELGVLYKKAGEYDKALSHFFRSVEIDPTFVKAQVNLARLHFNLGNKQLAREAFNHILTTFPEYESLARKYLQKLT